MLSNFTGIIQKGTREEALLGAVAWDRLPRHVAIIMDGNGRWAAQRGQPRIAGHKAGVEAVRAAVDRQNIKFQTIGRIAALPENVRHEIARATEQTARNKGMILTVALNYGGRAEIVDAARAAVRRLTDEGGRPDELTEERIASELYTRNLPELDLLVRTSGELRISNFLLWQSAYSEIYVTETLWPDFRRVHLLEAVVDYQGRDRRFGGLKLVVNKT